MPQQSCQLMMGEWSRNNSGLGHQRRCSLQRISAPSHTRFSTPPHTHTTLLIFSSSHTCAHPHCLLLIHPLPACCQLSLLPPSLRHFWFLSFPPPPLPSLPLKNENKIPCSQPPLHLWVMQQQISVCEPLIIAALTTIEGDMWLDETRVPENLGWAADIPPRLTSASLLSPSFVSARATRARDSVSAQRAFLTGRKCYQPSEL